MSVPVSRFLPAVVLSLLVGAAGVCGTPAQAQQKTLTVFAAASMKNALDDVDAAYIKKTGVKVVVSYAASSALMKQIEQGAPADVFVSADLDWMDYGSKKKVIKDDTRVNLLGNQIVLIAPKDSKVNHVDIGQGFDLAKLAGNGRVATGDVKAVPVGKYAKAALEKLGAWKAVEPKMAMTENVRAALALVARGRVRHRLRDRRQGRAEGQDRRRLPGRLASADRLPGRRHRDREGRHRGLYRVSAHPRRQDGLRKVWLHGAGQVRVVMVRQISASCPGCGAARSALTRSGAPLIRDPAACSWVPALQRTASRRAAPGTRA
jgi:molybdenum ABC transporter molybdate-binding protein